MAAITPKDAREQISSKIPEQVIEIVNELIVQNAYPYGNASAATVLQKDIVDAIVVKMGVNRNEVFRNNWLEFEDTFRKAGWKVTYDKPAYNETYEARFEFIPKRS